MTDKNNIDYRRLFFKFLKENNLYDKWVYNIKTQHSSIFKYQFFWKNKNKILFSGNCSSAINSAFCWDDTNEGYDFWERLEVKWKIFRRKTMEKN